MAKVQQLIKATEGNEVIKNLTQKSIEFINGNKSFAKHINTVIASKNSENYGKMSLDELHIGKNSISSCFPFLKIWGIWPIYSFLNVIDSELEDAGSEAAQVISNEIRIKLEAIEETLERLEGEARNKEAPETDLQETSP
ncbi:MAG TPA: hypothetical protein VMW09_03575 [Desulfatiglandales bacterium]|nr:hypothetical protein [Desulfatiglandales bacterium]